MPTAVAVLYKFNAENVGFSDVVLLEWDHLDVMHSF